MRISTAATFAAALVCGAHDAHAQSHGAGETCNARTDCWRGLRCSRNICVTEKSFEERRAPPTAIDKPDVARAFLGVAIGAVLPVVWGGVSEGFQGAVRFGALYGDAQFQLEVAPATFLFNIEPSALPLLDVTGSIGYFARISEMVSWIFRIGGGGGAVFGAPQVSSANVASFGELRIDVFGVAIRTSRHLLVELNAPSFRMMFMQNNSSNNFMAMFVTNVTFDYVF